MTEQAEQVSKKQNDDNVVIENQDVIEQKVEPAATENPGGYVETTNQQVQARINKLTAEKYSERNRANDLERRLSELEYTQQKPKGKPSLESFDYDEAQYNEALLDYKVNEATTRIESSAIKRQEQQRLDGVGQKFNAKEDVFRLKNPNYDEVAGRIPQLPTDTLNYLIGLDNAPELINFLGNHLDVADQLVNVSSMDAAGIIGSLSEKMTAIVKTVNASTAPEPITPIETGSQSSGDEWDNIAPGCTLE